MIDASSFRSRCVLSVAISYDWDARCGSAFLSLGGSGGEEHRFVLRGLSRFEIGEDFAAMHVEQCTFSERDGLIYLSLDPYLEGEPSERDNYVFEAKAIESLK